MRISLKLIRGGGGGGRRGREKNKERKEKITEKITVAKVLSTRASYRISNEQTRNKKCVRVWFYKFTLTWVTV